MYIINHMFLCEDNLVDWVEKQNGLMITRRKINMKQFDYKLQRYPIYACLTGYKQVISHFFEKLIPQFVSTSKIILIIVETDEVFLKNTWLDSSKVQHVYTWNKPFNHPKLSCIPIGLNFNRQYTVLNNWIDTSRDTISPKTKLLCMNCSLSTSPERVSLNETVKRNFLSFCDILPFVPPNKTYFIPSNIEGKIGIQETNPKCYKDWEPYMFILSPQGAGLDCHRTWEAMICGLIPIVKSSSIDELFKDLPVLIVKEWNEINESWLIQQQKDIALKKENGQYKMEKLTLEYWISVIDIHYKREFHFITYGNEKYEKAKQRLCSQANQFKGITHVRGYGPNDLPTSFRNKYKKVLDQPRGGGFWLWKPMVLYNHFKQLKENDILVYLDAGCKLNPQGNKRFQEYVNILDKSELGILSFQMHDQIEKWWTTREIFEYYDLDINGVHANSGQFLGGVFMLKKNKHSEEYVKKLVSITSVSYTHLTLPTKA